MWRWVLCWAKHGDTPDNFARNPGTSVHVTPLRATIHVISHVNCACCRENGIRKNAVSRNWSHGVTTKAGGMRTKPIFNKAGAWGEFESQQKPKPNFTWASSTPALSQWHTPFKSFCFPTPPELSFLVWQKSLLGYSTLAGGHYVQMLECLRASLFPHSRQATRAAYILQKVNFNGTVQEFVAAWAKEEDKAMFWGPAAVTSGGS